MGDFSYFWALAGVLLAETIIFITGHIVLFRKYHPHSCSVKDFFDGKTIHSSNASWLGKWGTIALTIFRISGFFFFFAVGILLNFITYTPIEKNWDAFTHWNMFFIAAYFFCASVSSIIYVVNEHLISENRSELMCISQLDVLGAFISVFHIITFATALFITIVTFSFLTSELSFWNIVLHLATSIAMLLEFTLTTIDIQFQDAVPHLLWLLLYVVISFIVVRLELREWRYYFMKTGTAGCFAWYNLMFILDWLCFFIVFGLSKCKLHITVSVPGAHERICSGTHLEDNPQTKPYIAPHNEEELTVVYSEISLKNI